MEENLAATIQALCERQQTAERQLSELSAVVKALEARITELGQPAARHETAAALAAATQTTPEKPMKGEVTPEIIVMLAAAATAFLGKKVRIRSARKLQSPYEIINPWAQQGRAFIQASHNTRVRR